MFSDQAQEMFSDQAQVSKSAIILFNFCTQM